jgi:hypothetical protein
VFLSGWCCGGVVVGKQKDMLIKDYIAQNVYTIGGYVEALVAFVHGTVADEDTLKGTVIEFGSVIRPEVRPTRTSENFKLGVCGWLVHEGF